MTNSAQTKRIDYIDRLKGLAIALVVMGHVYLFSYNHSSSTIPNVIGSFHMALFMFLSGFVSLSGITPPQLLDCTQNGTQNPTAPLADALLRFRIYIDPQSRPISQVP